MAITSNTLRLQEQLRAALLRITDAQTRDLVRAWVTAWDEIEPDLISALLEQLVAGEDITRAQLLRSTRLRNALAVVKDQLETLARAAGVRISGDLQAVLDAAGGAQASVIDSQLPAHGEKLVDLEAWSRVDARQLEAIVRRTTRQITSRARPLSTQAYGVVRRELIRGVAAGSNPRVTAARMVRRAEQGFNGGLTRALAIARTETLDASREAAQLGRMQHADVLRGWSWHCELSERSCPACISMDGTVFPNDDPGPSDHVNGRCTAVPITKSWADLGFDIPEPPSIRTSGSEWFGSLDAAAQRRILGPGRYDAWTAGHYPMGDWSTMRANDGWRESLQVTRVPAQSGGRVSPSAA